MKPWLILVLTAICAGPTPAQKHTAKPPFTLVLTAEKPTVSLGSDVWVKVRWTNTSDEELNASAYVDKSTNLDLNYSLEFRDSGGRPVPKIPDKSPVGRFFDAQFGALKPGETIDNDISLRRLYDLNRPGKYTLQVSRRVPEALGGGTIKSNIITITVSQ